MALEGMQSRALQQLGVTYIQLIDYSLKDYAATLVQVFILAMLIWDCTTTFDGEIAFFWQAKRKLRCSPARLLFLLNRYYPIIVFSLMVYWRTNRSLDNPLCDLRKLISYMTAPVYITTGLLQVLRVWSLYSRSRPVGFLLLALLICEAIGTSIARTSPTPQGVPIAQLAPESLTGCDLQPKGVFTCFAPLVMETILLTMIALRVIRSWKVVGNVPLFRALLLDGTTYYVIFVVAFFFETLANMSNELYYPVVDTNLVICVSVVASNHLMLSLREASGRPASTQPPTSFSRPTTGGLFTHRTSEVTYTSGGQVSTITALELDTWDHEQNNLGHKLGASHEMKPSHGSLDMK